MKEFLEVELKEVAEDGTFKGIASVMGMEDLGGDIINKGAFTKTVSENPRIPILWQHDAHEVIGEGEVKEWQGKLLITGKLDLEDPMGAKAYQKMKRRLVKGLSIGFQAIKTSWGSVGEKTVRYIDELKLWEVSVVTFPMLPAAQVTSVKAHNDLEARITALENEFKALAEKLAPAAEPKTGEPVEDHSQAMRKLTEIGSLLRA